MSLRTFLARNLANGLFLLHSIGKDRQYIYRRNGAAYHCRRSCSDRFVVDEVWNNAYPADIATDAIVVDAGANIGAFTVYAAGKATAGQVHAFEPAPRNIELLRRNIELNNLDNVTVHTEALAGKAGEATLYTDSHNKGGGTLYGDAKRSHRIRCITLADVFDRCNIERIDVLKVDIEGAEYDMLMNAPDEVLARVKQITLEYHDRDNLPHTGRDLAAFLESKGYDVTVRAPWFYRTLFRQGLITAKRCD